MFLSSPSHLCSCSIEPNESATIGLALKRVGVVRVPEPGYSGEEESGDLEGRTLGKEARTMKATLGIVLAAALVLAGIGLAAGEPAREDKAATRLKAILAAWEKANQSIQEIHYDFTRTDVDTTFNTKKVATGRVVYKKPDLLRLDEKETTGETTHWLVADGKLHWFVGSRKTEQIYHLPKDSTFPQFSEPDWKDKGFWEKLFIFAVTESTALLYLNYPIRQLEQNGEVWLKSEDENWICLTIKPHSPRFKNRFQQMEIVLNARTYQVKRVWQEQVNGFTMRIDRENVVINPRETITTESIRKELPQGFKQVEMGK
jgi:TIGR03009 family protein